MSKTCRLFLAIALFAATPVSAQIGAVQGISSVQGTAAAALPAPQNIVAHFAASSITGVANNGAVASWADSINGITFAQATGADQPTYTTNRLNGLPSVKVNGSQWLTLPNASAGAMGIAIDSQEYTAFVVFRVLGPGSGGGIFFSASVGASSFYFQADGTNVAFNRFFGNGLVPYAATSYSTLGVSAWNNGGILTSPPYSGSGFLQQLYINGGAVSSLISIAPGSGGNPYVIGAQTSAGANGANVEIFDIIVYNTHLTLPQYIQLQAWADGKYGQPHPWTGASAYNVFYGDSITAGDGGTGAVNAYPYLVAQSLGLAYGQWSQMGIGSITTAHMTALAPTFIDPLPALLKMKVNVSSFEWVNASGPGGPPAGPFADGQAYLTGRKAIPNLRTVWGTSTGYSGDPSANRNAYNADWDAIVPSALIDSYVALHNDSNIGTPTAFANNPANFADPFHLTNLGYTFLGNDFTTAIQALP